MIHHMLKFIKVCANISIQTIINNIDKLFASLLLYQNEMCVLVAHIRSQKKPIWIEYEHSMKSFGSRICWNKRLLDQAICVSFKNLWLTLYAKTICILNTSIHNGICTWPKKIGTSCTVVVRKINIKTQISLQWT